MPKTTGKRNDIWVRLDDERGEKIRAEVDGYRRRQEEIPSVAEAVRQLLEKGIAAAKAERRAR